MASTSEIVQTLPEQHVVLHGSEEASSATHPNTSKGSIFLPAQKVEAGMTAGMVR